MSKRIAVALQSCESANPSEISFVKGDIFVEGAFLYIFLQKTICVNSPDVLTDINAYLCLSTVVGESGEFGFYLATSRDTKRRGLIPKNYVKLILVCILPVGN
ncbi:hypothetical protein BKA69DRAFT_1080267 [Paraphysoderma sedebokerense]|nr:hypothetical protein BKA69DRAFT_1080267 [Paraphysoderma sedebokerense]